MDIKIIAINIIRIIILFYLSLQAGFFVYKLMLGGNKFSTMTTKAINTALGKNKKHHFNQEYLTAFMSKNGIMYMLKDYNLEPSTYISIKIGIGFLIGTVLFTLSSTFILKICLFGVGLFIGYFAPDYIFKMSNESDNKDMTGDIIVVYNLLKIHAKTGMYISDSLIECQRSVANKRLKEAFTELNNNILSAKITVSEAVDQFNARFNSQDIDNLSIIIKQSLQTGQASEMFADIAKQIETMNSVRAEAEKDRLKRKVAILQVIFFVAISGLALYLVGIEGFKSISTM